MKDWKQLIVRPGTSILQTVEIIDRGGVQIAVIVDSEQRLLGTVTDGDIRRGILKGIALTEPVEKVMSQNPMTSAPNEDRKAVLTRMTAQWCRRIPIVDSDGRFVGLRVMEEILHDSDVKPNWVLLMAGGIGSRLRPLTDNCPKPLLEVGGKPLLETTLLNFIELGFRNFYFSVNYKAEMIEAHFGDGSKWGVRIEYLRETERLGTAGCLGLLSSLPEHPLIVMNGDLLTKVNFVNLIDFHLEQKAKATMCVREYDFQVPYGVVRIEKESITSIDEKPIQKFFVNGGIYVLDPEVVSLVPSQTYCDMPTLLGRVAERGGKTAAFPIREYWVDIGQMTDFERANGEFTQLFVTKTKKDKL